MNGSLDELKGIPDNLLGSKNRYNQTLLHWSAASCKTDVTSYLLQKQPTLLNQYDDFHKTALGYALLSDHIDNVNTLLQAGSDPNITQEQNYTPLHIATSKQNNTVVTTLLNYHADPNHQDQDGWTPIHWAAADCNIALFNLLKKHGASLNIENQQGYTPLDILKKNAPEHLTKVIKVYLLDLLQQGDQTCFLNYLKRYLDYDPDESVTYFALRTDQFWLLPAALTLGESLTEPDDLDETPLHKAVRFGNPATVSWLIEWYLKHKIDLRMRNHEGKLPLHIAARFGHNQIITLLLKHGNINTRDHYEGWTPLHEATYEGYVETTKLLLRQGADPNKLDFDQRTPLHYAVEQEEIEVVRLLVKNGGNPALKDFNGETPFALSPQGKVKDLLRKYYKKALLEQNILGE